MRALLNALGLYNFKGFADLKLGDLKSAQLEFDNALATGAATPDESARMTRTLFGIAASTGQYQATIDYGEDMTGAGAATLNDLAIIAQSYYRVRKCKDSIFWSDRAITVKLTHKTAYWNALLRIERQGERDDHNSLMIYRIMYNTNSMNADTDYIEMAQLLGDAALPRSRPSESIL